MNSRLLPSFAAYPVFPYFAACVAAASAAGGLPALRGFSGAWAWLAAAFVLAEITLSCFRYFGARAAWARNARIFLRAAAVFFACLEYFYFRVDPAPEKVFAPLEASAAGIVLECSRSASGGAYGVIEIRACSAEGVEGRRAWFSVFAPKDSSAQVPDFRAGDEVEIFGTLRCVRENPPRAWGYASNPEREASFSRYLLGRFVYYKISASASGAKVLRRGENRGLGAEAARWAGASLGIFAFGVRADSPSARALRAMVLGDKSSLSPRQKDVFRSAGAMHIFAVSGLHVGMLACGIYFLCALFCVPIRWRIVAALPVLWLYVLAVGAPPSAVRAFLMVCAFWLAFSFSRGSSALNALMLSFLAAFAISPESLFSAGFQLSYAVVAVICALSAGMYSELEKLYINATFDGRRRGLKYRLFAFFAGGLSVSLGASLAALPISAHWFGMFSFSGIIFSPVFVLLAAAAVYAAFAGMLLPPFLAGVLNSAGADAAWLMSSLAGLISGGFPAVARFSAGSGWAVFCVEFCLIWCAACEKINVWLRFCACAFIVAAGMLIIWIF